MQASEALKSDSHTYAFQAQPVLDPYLPLDKKKARATPPLHRTQTGDTNFESFKTKKLVLEGTHKTCATSIKSRTLVELKNLSHLSVIDPGMQQQKNPDT